MKPSSVCPLAVLLALGCNSNYDQNATMSETLKSLKNKRVHVYSSLDGVPFRVESQGNRTDLYVYDSARIKEGNTKDDTGLIVFINGFDLNDEKDMYSPINERPRSGNEVTHVEYLEVLKYLRQAVKDSR